MVIQDLEADQKTRIRVTALAMVGGIIILALKWAAYEMTQSTALKSDAIESIVNVVAAIFALGAVIFAGKPADKDHPYGHGKIEYFSAAFEGGLISFASAFIFYEAIKSFFLQPELHALNNGMLLNFFSGLLNGALGWYMIRVGRKHNSRAMEADGHHILSDFYTTIGILAGLLLVKFTGLAWLDPLIAVFIGMLLAYTGFRLVRRAARALLDEEDPDLIVKLVNIINRLRSKDVIDVHALRTMRAGRFTHVDIHVIVPEFYEIGRAHDLVEGFGQKVIAEAQIEGEFHSHIDPCHRSYCVECMVAPCPVRQKEFVQTKAVTVESATDPGPMELGMGH